MIDKLPIVIKNKQIARIGKELAILSKILPDKFDKWEWWNALSETWKKVFIVNCRFGTVLKECHYIDSILYDDEDRSKYGIKQELLTTDINDYELDVILNLREIRCACHNCYSDFKLDTLEPISKLKKLDEIDFSGCQIRNICFSQIKDIGIVCLSSVFYTDDYNDYVVNVDYDCIDVIGKIKKLNLDNNYILDKGDFIFQLPDLEELTVSDCFLDINNLIKLDNIKKLNLSCCGINDNNILLLSELQFLENLDVRNTYNYTNYYHFECFEPINVDWSKKNKLKLRNDISYQNIVLLKEKLPNCKIRYDDKDGKWADI